LEALAPLDVLASARLVNYFGTQAKVDNIEIAPVLLRKGATRVALYGLGNVRDERLNRTWEAKKVKFLRPAEDDDADGGAKDGASKFFNVFVLHQNRDAGRGTKNCVHESMIPEWMDLVIWGHEHECRIDPRESATGTFRLTQPGSSVATSLVPGEAEQKHVALMSIRGDSFKLEPLKLTAVRPFVHDDLVLGDVASLASGAAPEGQAGDAAAASETDVAAVLAEKVETLVRRALADAPAPRYADQQFKLQDATKVLVRLRVDHTGFPKINAQRFGGSFVAKVANPAEVLHFVKKARRAAGGSKKGARSKKRGGLDADDDDDVEDDQFDDVEREDDMDRDVLCIRRP